MSEHQFSGLIKCLNCGKNFKKKWERKKPVYICSGFANYSSAFCRRYVIEEEELIYNVTKHMAINGIGCDNDLGEYVELIEVKDGGYIIKYTDKTTSIFMPHHIKY